MKSFTATIVTVAPSNPIDYLQDFMKSTFAKLGIIITHFHPTIYQNIFAHIKFDFYIEHNDGTLDYQERKTCAIKMLNQLKKAPIEITHTPGHQWSMSL
jgi:hypothetical protein